MNARGMDGFDVYIFDYDGTLAATRPAAARCLAVTLRERGDDRLRRH